MGLTFRLTALALLCSPGCAKADEVQSVYSAELAEAPADFVLAADALEEGAIQVVNGAPVSGADWQSLVFASLYAPGASAPGATCTGTLVGPYVLLTAAHCIDRGNVTPRLASLRVDGYQFTFRCDMHPAYRERPPRERVPRGSADYALCELNLNRPPPPTLRSVAFAGIDITTKLARSAPVILTGYGCTDYSTTAQNGRLNIGRTVTTARDPNHPNLIAIRADIATQSALCEGDSGGPMLRDDAPILRRNSIVGVNSWIRHEAVDERSYVTSYVAATARDLFIGWARTWLKAHPNAVICGVNDSDASPCPR